MLRHKANLAASTPRLPPAGMEIAAYGDSQAVGRARSSQKEGTSGAVFQLFLPLDAAKR